MNSVFIFTLGFLAQFLFFGRTILQWFKSEHEGEVISPKIFWQLSLIASTLMLLYGIFRNDFSIVLGQLLVYYIYVRNLHLKNAWMVLPSPVRWMACLMPVIFVIWLIFGNTYSFATILGNEEVAGWLLVWGSAGQVVFTFRFIYQWIYSEKEKESKLPLGFWVFSTLGSMMIFVYSVFRLDPVLFLAHSLGLFMYIRNIFIYFGKSSLFSRIDIPVFRRITGAISKRVT